MDVLGIILARAGSKRLPGKNSLQFCGKPLISWTIEAAVNSGLSGVVLSSDCPKCLEIANTYQIQSHRRPATLALDDTTSAAVVLDVMAHVRPYEYVILLQPTSPLRDSGDINGMLRCYFALREIAGDIIMNSANVATKKLNGAMYLAPWNRLIETQDFKTDYEYWMPEEKSIDIDTIEDFEQAEKIMRGHKCRV